MPEMTPREAAEKLESLIDYAGDTLDDALKFNLRKVVDTTASYLRAIAAGEYKQVVHGHWENRGHLDQCCSICGEAPEREQGETPPDYDICPYCGALMGGKDDSHEI